MRAAGTSIEVLRRPERHELDLEELDEQLLAAQAEVIRVRREREAVKQEGARSRDDRRARKEANERAKRLNEKLREAEAEADSLGLLLVELKSVFRELHLVAACPVCAALGQSQTAAPVARHRGTFRCSCPDCGSYWGTAPCACGAKIPFLVGQGARPEIEGGVDLALGQDVLAVPAAGKPDEVRCDQCGAPVAC